jgi:hypothetical protein
MTIDADNGLANWEVFYKIINHCNLVLKYAPEVAKIDPNYTQGKQYVHLSEALTLRALAYFYLVRIYKDVPYIRIPYDDDKERFSIPKTDGEIILEDMVEDLKFAADYSVITRGMMQGISTVNGVFYWTTNSASKCRITRHAVRALLADIYLWQASGLKDNLALQTEKYAACIEECEKIETFIIDFDEMLLDNFSKFTGAELMFVKSDEIVGSSALYVLFYLQNSCESIFELQFDNRMPTKTIAELYGHATRAGNLSAAAKEDWISDQDIRRKFSYAPEKDTRHRILKYVLDAGNSVNKTGYFTSGDMPTEPGLLKEDDYRNWIFYRLSDVYLMKAEALVELGGEENLRAALELVNKTYMRSNPKQLYSLTFEQYKDKMRMLVLQERGREFLFEGKRWFDLMRLWRRENGSDIVINLMTRKYKGDTEIIRRKLAIENALYMPIYKSELINNSELVQNEFYKTDIDTTDIAK